jgi:hypothetical protein
LFAPRSALIQSMGIGKMIVEFFSAATSVQIAEMEGHGLCLQGVGGLRELLRGFEFPRRRPRTS